MSPRGGHYAAASSNEGKYFVGSLKGKLNKRLTLSSNRQHEIRTLKDLKKASVTASNVTDVDHKITPTLAQAAYDAQNRNLTPNMKPTSKKMTKTIPRARQLKLNYRSDVKFKQSIASSQDLGVSDVSSSQNVKLSSKVKDLGSPHFQECNDLRPITSASSQVTECNSPRNISIGQNQRKVALSQND